MPKASLITHSIGDLFEGFKLGSLGVSRTPKVSRDEISEPTTIVDSPVKTTKVIPKVWGQSTSQGTGISLSALWSEIFDDQGYTSIRKFSYFTGKTLEREELVGKPIDLRLSIKLMTKVTNFTVYCLEFLGYMNDASSRYDKNTVLKGYLDVVGQYPPAIRKMFLKYQTKFTTKGLRSIDPRQWRLTEPPG
jgi:hypothetical protein